ncbi:putative serine/threonine-protein kinase VPS15 [Diplonema papillatum]|nr:putative serine/threonine-protein kinase VPS15 [Diplonema papillatum]
MGNQLAMGVDMNPADILEGLKPKAPLGGGKGRLLRSLHCTSEDGDVVCKMFLKTDVKDDKELDSHHRRLNRCEASLKELRRKNPEAPTNVCFYSLYKNVPWTDRADTGAAFVIRTFFRYSLQERIMTRPFLTSDSKLWLSFQLLKAVQELHAAHVPHGDLKVQNVMITSLGWLYVTDVAPFKPSHISNPADFSYFFDSAENRHCNLAPERITDDSLVAEKQTDPVTEKMDVFGVGCAIAQVFQGGEVLFKLDQLLAYKNGKYDAASALRDKLQGEEQQGKIVDFIMALLARDPEERPTASQALAKFCPSVFPKFFDGFHSKIIGPLVSLSPDKRVSALTSQLKDILQYVRTCTVAENDTEAASEEAIRDNLRTAVVILATVLCGSLRHCLIMQNRTSCLQAMMEISPHAGDDCNLQMLLPYAVVAAKNETSLVRATAVKTISVTLQNIESFPTGEATLFDDYIIPAITPLATDPTVLVKAALAECLPEIASHARRLLESRQLFAPVSESRSDLPYNNGYDADLNRLQNHFETLIRLLVLDGDVSAWVTRAFLSDIPKLCLFYGRQRTNNFIIPTLTISVLFLNAPDFQVRRDLQRQLVGIALFVGATFLSYILPCIKEGLLDVEEIVVHEALNSLSKLSALGMLDKKALVDLSEVVVPLLLHPSNWIRTGALDFFASMGAQLSHVDLFCFILPILKPFLKYPVPELAKETLEAALVPRIPRQVFDEAISRGSADAVLGFLQDESPKSLRYSQKRGSDYSLSSISPGQETSSLGGRSQSNSPLEPAQSGGTESFLASGPVLAQGELQKQQVQKYIESIVKAANRCKEDAKHMRGADTDMTLTSKGDQPDAKVVGTGQTLSLAREQALLPQLKELEFTRDEIDSLHDHCPNLRMVRPTERQKRRMQSKSLAVEKKGAPTAPSRSQDAAGYSILKYTRPTHNLICQAEEHSASVTDISVHDTLPIFITSSMDTYVRLWDVRKLDKDSALVSLGTGYCDTTSQHGTASPVLSVAMLSRKESAACGTASGSFTTFCLTSSVVLHALSLAGGQAGAISSLQRAATSDTVVAGTHNGFICGVDCRMHNEAFCIKAEKEHGPITSIVVGDEQGRESWVVSATMTGHVTLWDLRFQIPIRTWQVNEPVYKLSLNGPDPVVLVGTSTVQRWSLENLRRVAVYIPSTHEPGTPAKETRNAYADVVGSIGQTHDNSIRALCGSREATWFATGGTDRKIRYWDSESVTKSYVVSGTDPGQPPYKYSSSTANETMEVREEKMGEGASQVHRGLRPPPQQHKDCVTALSLLRPVPGFCHVPIMVSASRDGCVKLWQSACTKPQDRNAH